METVMQAMSEDHDRLDRIFREFQQVKQASLDKAKGLFHEFKVGLQRHIVWEEEILFPLFEQKTGMRDAGPTAVMRMEHRKIKEFLERIHHGISAHAETSDAEGGLLEVLGEHNDKEECILYPWIDSATDETEKEQVFARMKSLPPERYSQCCGSKDEVIGG